MTDGIVFIDVDYRENATVAAWLIAENWQSPIPITEGIVVGGKAEPYEPGNFYRREMPFIQQALDACPGMFSTIVIDGFVWLGQKELGLGARLYSALDRRFPVIGVAKRAYDGNPPAIAVTRGESKQPLFVTTVGCELVHAADQVRNMYGPYRLPDLIKRVDRLCRDAT